MKKVFVLIAVLLLTSTMLFAQSINLGQFPKGKWVDSNWNAIWEFGSDNIRLLDNGGNLVYDFNGKIADFKVDVGLTQAKISFSCQDSGRTYVFTKGLSDTNLTMTIDPNWTDTNYSVTMTFKN